MSVTIYHNPRCGKSREALKLLQDAGRDPVIVDYLTSPPSVGEFKRILKMLGKRPAEVVRRKEAKEAGVDVDTLSDDALVAAMVKHPILIERPIVICDNKAALGRPPAAVLEIL